MAQARPSYQYLASFLVRDGPVQRRGAAGKNSGSAVVMACCPTRPALPLSQGGRNDLLPMPLALASHVQIPEKVRLEALEAVEGRSPVETARQQQQLLKLGRPRATGVRTVDQLSISVLRGD